MDKIFTGIVKRKTIGVTKDKVYGKFVATIVINRKEVYLGYFKTELEAIEAYENAAKNDIGHFHRSNYFDNNTDDPRYKRIELTLGMVAIVDSDEFERLNQYTWQAHKEGKGERPLYYAWRNIVIDGKKTMLKMHIDIMGNTPDGFTIDHKDRNGLHNWKDNLRICTSYQNSFNHRAKQNAANKYKGVSLAYKSSTFRAQIRVYGKQISLGNYKTDKEAALAYNKAALRYHGEYAYINIIE